MVLMSSIRSPSVARQEKDRYDWFRTVCKGSPPGDMDEYLHKWEAFFDHYAAQVDRWHLRNAGYHKAIASLARFCIPPDAKVLEIGSGNGDLLAALKPSYGLGVDISGEMVRLAANKYPGLKFRRMPAERLDLPGEQFDFVVLSDLVGYLYDIHLVFERLRRVCHRRTRLVIHWYSNLWQPILALAERIGLKYPQPLINWTTVEDIQNLLHLAGFELVHRREHILLPKQVRLVTRLANRYLAHLPGFRWMCLTNWIVARPRGLGHLGSVPTVSVICPCRNEAGNIEQVVRRLPSMGSHTQLIFVEGHSKDDTLE